MPNLAFYFDYNATTPVHPDVIKEVNKYMSKRFGNPGSVHSFGLEAYEGVDKARKMCAKLINASKEEIIFTSGGTESDNLAIQGILENKKCEKPDITPHLITSNIEHPAVYNTALQMQKRGFEVTFLPVNKIGRIDLQELQNNIKKSTALISIMYANNEIGIIQEIKEIGKIAKEKGVLFHTDAVQAITKVPIDVKRDNIDFLSASGHKFYGPKGIGFLFVKNDEKVEKNQSSANKYMYPLIFGGSQEFDMRPATENVPGIVGMGKAAEIAMKDFKTENKRLKNLQTTLIDTLFEKIPKTHLNGPIKHRIPNNINIRFEGINAYDLMIKMDNEGFALSVGAACHAQSIEPSRVLKNIGLSDEQASSSLRISLGRWTKEKALKHLIEKLAASIINMRGKTHEKKNF